MRWRERLLALCASCVLSSAPVLAEKVADGVAPQYVPSLRNYGAEQGLPQASVNALVQTRDGYLWLATYGGLVRFDGLDFVTYRAAPGGLGSNRITDLYEDPHGRLWIATQGGGLALRVGGRFQSLDFCHRACYIQGLHASRDGKTLWLLDDRGVYEIDLDTLAWQQRADTPGAYAQIEPMPDGAVYVSGSHGLHRIDARGTQPVALPAGEDAVGILHIASSGRFLWVLDDSRRLYRYDTRDDQWWLAQRDVPSLRSFVVANTGQVYLSSEDGAGMWQLHDDGTQTPLRDVPAGVFVRAVYTDKEGDTWLGSNTQGVWRVRAARVGLMNSAQFGMRLPARAIVEDGAGGFWFGMNCSLLHWRGNGELHRVDMRPLGNECVQSLARDRQSRLWISTYVGTLGWLPSATDDVGTPVIAAAWPDDGPLDVWVDPRDGTHWINNYRRTFRIDVDARGRVTGEHPLPALDGMQIAHIGDSRRGGAWFVGNLGAFRVVDGRIVEQLSGKDDPDFHALRWLHEDADGSLWIGSYDNGLLHVSRDGRVQRWDRRNGLFDDAISCVLEDARGRLWLGSNNGIAMLPTRALDAREPEQLVLAASDGLVPAEMNGGTVSTCLRDGRGRLWFSLISGYAVVDPARTDVAVPPPQAHIDHLAFAGKDLDLTAPGKLGVNASSLDIGYDAVSFAYPERLRFRYRLLPGDQQWVDAGDRRSLLVSSVPWGKFRFEVQARLPGSAWSPSATIVLERPMPWYRWKLLWLLASFGGLLGLLWATRDSPLEAGYRELLDDTLAPAPDNAKPANPQDAPER